MNDLTLDKEEIKKFKGLSLDPGVIDAVIALGFQLFFMVLIQVFHPPIFRIIKSNFIWIITYFCLFTIPILLISIIDIINNYKVIKKNRNETGSKDYKLISTLSFYTIPLLFLTYLPTNILEFYIWIITVLALYVGFGKFPLIKYSIEIFHFPSNNLYFNKKIVRNIIPSIYCLGMTMWIVLLAISLSIYPIPFLLLYYFKYLIQHKYFYNLSSEDFYENWNRSEKFLKRPLELGLLSVCLISGILFAAAAY